MVGGGEGEVFVFISLRRGRWNIGRWLLEMRLRLGRVAAKGQRLEGGSSCHEKFWSLNLSSNSEVFGGQTAQCNSRGGGRLEELERVAALLKGIQKLK